MGRKAKKNANGEGSYYKMADGRWRGRITVRLTEDGQQVRRSVYGRTKTEAVEKLATLRTEVLAGLDVDSKLRVGDYLRSWLKGRKAALRPKTHADYEYTAERYIIPKVGRVVLDKLRPQHVLTMVTEIADEVSNDRANKARRLLHTALKQAVRQQRIARNPAEVVDPLPVQRREMTLWSAEQATRFLDTARGHRLYAAFHLLMSTGLRCGELLGLHWDDLEGSDLVIRRSVVHVKGKLTICPPKTKKGERRVSLTPAVLEILLEHRRRQAGERAYLGDAYGDNDIMFASTTGTYLHPRNLKRTFDGLQAATREAWVAEARADGNEDPAKLEGQGKLLPHTTLHDLRHLHASMAIRSGMDPKTLADRLGHTSPSLTLNVYTHLFEEHRARSAIDVTYLLGSSSGLPN